MNRLKYARGYLSGAIDRVKDGGLGWRIELQERLADLEILWLDPTCKPIDIGIENLENRQHRCELKQNNKYDILASELKTVRAIDLRMVDLSDFTVVNIDTDVHACGTYEELFLANRQKKPIIVHMEQGKRNCPDWLFGTIPHEMIFSTWYDVCHYLYHIAHDPTIKSHKRWLFFDYDLCRKF